MKQWLVISRAVVWQMQKQQKLTAQLNAKQHLAAPIMFGKYVSNLKLFIKYCSKSKLFYSITSYDNRNTANGGTCWMIGGTAAKSDAVYTGDLNAVCGITSSIAWNGNWAFNCDFNNHNLSNAKVSGDQCSSKCTATSGCTHFTWFVIQTLHLSFIYTILFKKASQL